MKNRLPFRTAAMLLTMSWKIARPWRIFPRKSKIRKYAFLTSAAFYIGLADYAGLGQLFLKFPDYSKPAQRYSVVRKLPIGPCSDPDQSSSVNAKYHADCQKTAQDITAAVDMWKKTMRGLDKQKHPTFEQDVPDFLGDEYALRAAALESDMGRLRFADGTYEGLYQFSRTNKSALLFTRMDMFLEILNAAKKDIPVLSRIKSDKITKKHLLSDEVFHDSTVQVYLKMTSAYLQYLSQSQKPDYKNLSQQQEIALSYLGHLLPAAADFSVSHMKCAQGLNEATYNVNGVPRKFSKGIFAGNSGMLEKSGNANPSEVLARFYELTNPAMQEFAPQYVRTAPPTVNRGTNGIAMHIVGKYLGDPACVNGRKGFGGLHL